MTSLSLSSTDFAALSPLLILLAGALILLLLETFAEKGAKAWSLPVAFGTLLFALVATVWAPASNNPLLTNWLRYDSLAHLFTLFFLIIGLGILLLSATFFQTFNATRGEYYFFLIAAIFGLVLIGAAADFLTLFLGLETLSIASYILCGYMKRWKISDEAAMKYFLMGALAAAILLYGIALIYGAIGTTRFDALLSGYHSLKGGSNLALFMSGIALVTLGLAFKAAIVPLHTWAPDAYDGAPTPVTAFMAIGTKVGAFAAFARVFLVALPNFDPRWNEAISLLAYPTLIYANLVAMRQVQLRRFFAYSGISHAGFMLMPLAAGTPAALDALLFYMAVYAIATMGCFAVLASLDFQIPGVMMDDLRGLIKRCPWRTAILTICLMTLAGIPPTVGFFAKFYVFKVTYQAGYLGLVIVGLLMAILSAYYYMRIISLMITEAPADASTPPKTMPALVLGVIAMLAITLLSLYPAPLQMLLAV